MTLIIGQPAPNFELLNQDGQPVRLSDYRGQKVVIFSFPKANSLGCNAQACTFQDELHDFQNANAVILGINWEMPETLKNWKQSKKLSYDLLSDPDHHFLEAWGAWGMSIGGLIKLPTAARAYWVIDENGLLVDQQIGVGPGESVRKALQAVERMAAAG